MIKLKDILNESPNRDFNIKAWKDELVNISTDSDIIVLTLKDKDGLDGVNKKGSNYIISFKGKDYTIDELFKVPDIKKKLKDSYKNLEKTIDNMKTRLPYVDRNQSAEREKIRKRETALKTLKKYT